MCLIIKLTWLGLSSLPLLQVLLHVLLLVIVHLDVLYVSEVLPLAATLVLPRDGRHGCGQAHLASSSATTLFVAATAAADGSLVGIRILRMEFEKLAIQNMNF